MRKPCVRCLCFRFATCLAIGILPLALTGCGQKKSLPEGYAEAYGTITLDGQPVKDAEVIFETEKGESYGRTDANGYYHMERTRSLTGAGTGPALVKISTRADFGTTDQSELHYDAESDDYVKQESIPAKYRQGIEIEVTEDGAPYDFPLTSGDTAEEAE